MGSSSEEDVDVQDGDLCTEGEINKLFKGPLYLGAEEAISLKKNYILHLDATQSFDKVIATTSENTVHLFDLSYNNSNCSLGHININSTANDHICGIKFSKTDSNIVYICSSNGKIYQRDLRQQKAECFEFNDAINKSFICFDNNANNSVLCIGTEQISSESSLLFFDIRQRSPLSTYRNIHRDDITDIKFHPTLPNVLASGSTDGLINIFDISNPTEDDALQYCLNTESSVQTLNWHQTQQNKNRISCITHLNDFILYDVEESEEIVAFKRNEITKLIRRKSSNECYLVNSHTVNQEDILLIAGSNYNKGECLRTMILAGKDFIPRSNLENNKQIVRCSAYDAKNDVLITAGEGGIVSVWQTQAQDRPITSEKRKEIKHKDRNSKPY